MLQQLILQFLITLNKWHKEKLLNDFVIHGFRHSFRDRLRNRSPSDIIDQLWVCLKSGGINKGYELWIVLGKWLLKL